MFRLDQANNKQKETVGIGLGLYTSNILAEAVGGSLEILSPISNHLIMKGTEITFKVKTNKN